MKLANRHLQKMTLGWNLTALIQLLGLPDKVGNNGFQKESFSNGTSGSEEEEEGRVEKRLKGVLACKEDYPGGFQMPLQYPRYKKRDYENMEDWKLDMLLREYGLNFKGNLQEKRAFAMGMFLWPNQL